MPPRKQSVRSWEAHFRTIVAAIILGGIGWVLKVSSDTHAGLKVLRAENVVQYESLRRELDDMKTQTQDRYTRTDAQRDLELRDNRLDAFGSRLRALERSLPRDATKP